MTTSSVAFNFEFHGAQYQCFYCVEGREPAVIHISTPWGPRTGALGAASPIVVARLMAAELARGARVN